MKKAIGVGLFLVGFVFAVAFFLPLVARAEKEQPSASAPTAKDLLVGQVEKAKALLKEGKLDDAEAQLLSVRKQASDQKIALGSSTEKTINKLLGEIGDKRTELKKKALMGRFAAAEDLYKQSKFAEAQQAFVEIKKDAEAQKVDLGFWTKSKLNSYIKKSASKAEEALKKTGRESKAAEAEKAKASAETLKQTLLAKFAEGEKLYKDGKYREAQTLLQDVSDASNVNGISLGYSVSRRLRNYLEDANRKIVEAAKAESDAKLAEKQEKVRNDLLQKFADAEALYKEGKYAEAKTAFQEIQVTRQKEKTSLGYFKDRTVDSYVSKCDSAIAKAAEDAGRAQKERLEKEAAEKARTEKEAEDKRVADLKNSLLVKFDDAEKLYKAGKYAEAKTVFEEIRATRDKEKINLGFLKDGAVNSYISKCDSAVARSAQDAGKAEKDRLEKEAAEKARTEKAAEEKRVADLKNSLLVKFDDAEKLYKAGKYAEAKTAFEEVRATRDKEKINLGFLKDGAVNSYISKCDSAIARSAEDARKAEEARVAREAAETARRQQEADAAAKAEKERLEKEASRTAVAEKQPAPPVQVDAGKAEKEAEEKRLADLKRALLVKFDDAEKLYKAGKYAEAKAAFEEIRAARDKEKINLGFLKDGAVNSYISKCDSAIAKAAEDAGKAEKERLESQAREKTQKEKDAQAAAREELKTRLLNQFKEGESLYKAAKYAEAKPVLLDVKNVSESAGIDLGFWNSRNLNKYLTEIEQKKAQADQAAQRAQKAADEAAKKPEQAAVKPGEAAKKPEEVAAKPAVKPAAEVKVDEEAARRAKAEAAYKTALEANRRGDYTAAVQNAYAALSIMPDYYEAAVLLESAQAKLDRTKIEERPYEDSKEAEREAAEVQIVNLLAGARKAMAEKKYLVAQGFAEQAKAVAAAKVSMGFENYVQEADEFLKVIAPKVAEEKYKDERKLRQETRDLLRDEKDKAALAKQHDIETLMASAKDNIRKEAYAAAEQDLDAILMIKPDHALARVYKELVGQWAAQKLERDASVKSADSLRKLNTHLSEQLIFTITPPLQFPPNWLEAMAGRTDYMGTPTSQYIEADIYRGRAALRQPATLETQEVEKKLQKRLPYFEFSGQPFMTMIDFLRSTSGLNIVVDPKAAPTADQTITLQLTDATVKVILDLMTAQVALKWTVRENFVYISDEAGIAGFMISGAQLTIVYDVRDLIMPVEDWGGGTTGGTGGRGSTGGTGGRGSTGGTGSTGGRGSTGGTGSRQFGGGFGDENAGSGGRQFGGPGGESATERGTGATPGFGQRAPGGGAPGGGSRQSYTATDTAGYDLATLIMETVDRSVWNVPPDSYTVRYMTGGRLVVYAQPETQRRVVDFLMQLREIRAIYVLVESREVKCGTWWMSSFATNWTGVDFIAEDLAAGRGPWTQLSAIVDTGGRAVAGPIFGTRPDVIGGTTLNVGFFDGVELAAFLHMMEESQDSELVDYNVLMLSNGQQSYIDNTRTQDYPANVTATVAESAVAIVPQIQRITYGTTVTYRPTVSYDRRYVTLDVYPLMDTLDASTPYVFPGYQGAIIQQLQTTSSFSLRSTVSVPDGGTVFVGGRSQAFEGYGERGAPLLSKIPVLGAFFKAKERVKEKASIIYFVTPHIIIRDEYESRL